MSSIRRCIAGNCAMPNRYARSLSRPRHGRGVFGRAFLRSGDYILTRQGGRRGAWSEIMPCLCLPIGVSSPPQCAGPRTAKRSSARKTFCNVHYGRGRRMLGSSSHRRDHALPFLCPAGPRHILELDLLQPQFEPRELGLVIGNPASLDRPQASRRRCELGGDRVMGHPARPRALPLPQELVREPGRRARRWSRRPAPRNRGSDRVEPSRWPERRRRACSATQPTLPRGRRDGAPRREDAAGRQSSAPARSTPLPRRLAAPTRSWPRRGVPRDVPARGEAFGASGRERPRRAAPRRAGGAARGALLYPVESESPSRSPV